MLKIVKNDREPNNQKILVSELVSRFELARSSVYDKLKKLSIRPFTAEDGKKYITLEELEFLEELENFLKEKRGDTKDFVRLHMKMIDILSSEDVAAIESEEPQIPEATVTEGDPPQTNTLAQSTEQAISSVSGQQLTILESEQIEISPEASQQSAVEQLQVQKGLQTQAQDLQEVNKRAQERAFAKIVAEESLVIIFEATENFTPEQKQQLAQHRAECDRARKARNAAHDVNDFLSRALSGLISLPNSNSNPSTSPNGASNNV
ncbi:hypothetical protein [Scytonema sp. NUACC26]|uniref:hypothetical protein n=1 Tax=Scytonema sp. NUACC26 TaxID=3140176 RepID=UPI0034DCC095